MHGLPVDAFEIKKYRFAPKVIFVYATYVTMNQFLLKLSGHFRANSCLDILVIPKLFIILYLCYTHVR